VSNFVQLLASGIAQGAIYALAALGFLLLYKATGVFNFAQGDLMTLGAYLAYWGVNDLGMPVALACILSIALLFVGGVVLERVAYAPLRGQSMYVVVIATLGAATAIRAGIGIWQGSDPKRLDSLVGQNVFELFGATIAMQRVVIIGVTAVAVAAIASMLYRTQLGRQFRALADDREAAQLQGIRASRLAMLAFGLSTAVSALGGIMIAPLSAVDLNLGFGVMLGGFAAALIGGFGSMSGVIVGGVLIGVVQSVVGAYVMPNYSEAYPYILMIAVIAVAPRGIFREHSSSRL